MNKNKEFKSFIKKTLTEIMHGSGLDTDWKGKIHYHLDRYEKNKDDDVSMGISPCVLGRSFDLHIFKDAIDNYKKGDIDDIVSALCHEVAHICTSDICKLIEQPYKSPQEVEKEDEMLANRVGSYLERLYIRGKHKCQDKKSKTQYKTKNKRR